VLLIDKNEKSNDEDAVTSIRLRLTDSVESFSGKPYILPI